MKKTKIKDWQRLKEILSAIEDVSKKEKLSDIEKMKTEKDAFRKSTEMTDAERRARGGFFQ